MSNQVTPHSLKDAPAFIEQLLPVQKISAESYKEQMAGAGKTLAPLGSYWKGRKPLILNKSCILGCLLPATQSPEKDLEIFELLMGMDDRALKIRLALDPAESLPNKTYRQLVSDAKRPEELGDNLYTGIWEKVNQHLGTKAYSLQQLVEQLGIMRFGHRPIVADTFCGSGQIPFEAARLGCDVYASDLNPIACLLTWGAFNIVGASNEKLETIKQKQKETAERVSKEIDDLNIEQDGKGWRAKVFLYCVEAKCPQSGWMVPLLPSLIISKQRTGDKFNAIVELTPDHKNKRYDIKIRNRVTDEELQTATAGTVRTDGRGQDPYLIHTIDGQDYKTKISTLRGDYTTPDGETKNRLRMWEKIDFIPRKDDIYQERLYAIQWVKDGGGRSNGYEFREVTKDDLAREQKVIDYVRSNLVEWQQRGYIPDSVIEPGAKTDEPIRTRGWTHWHHLFNPRQLLVAGLVNKYSDAAGKTNLTQILNYNSRLSIWDVLSGGGGSVKNTFYNQALNTLFTYGTRAFIGLKDLLKVGYSNYPLGSRNTIISCVANQFSEHADLFITDPPYGDAVKYEEITEFFIGWLKKSNEDSCKSWVWDSRRSLAIKGEDEDFRKGMVAAYSKMTSLMPDNGMQIIMFTHQSGSIWADMANIVWASGLQVTAAWYVVTETDSPMREGSYVKGTVLLVLRKRSGALKTSRDDLAWEIQEEVEKQVRDLTGLNQATKNKNRNENLFEDADLQMAGYAAALRVLTRYSIIDGRDMPSEAIKPRVRGQTTFVDSLIEFAVATANQALVPEGLTKSTWDKLIPGERFILKMLDMEARGAKTLDNYQNFAKAFKVRDFNAFLQSRRANDARLKSAIEFGRTDMNEGSELYQSTLRAVYYAMWELSRDIDPAEVLQHLSFNVVNYYSVPNQRDMVVAISDYLSKKLNHLRPAEASYARIIGELVKNQRVG